MLELHFTDSADLYGELNKVLSRHLPSYTILRTENGKPYLEGNPLFFSLSHSKGKAVIAVSDKPVGVDLEKVEDRSYGSILSRFSEEERREISNCNDFLKHWVVREAYIKMLGTTIAEKLKHLEYVNGALYDGGKKANYQIICGERGGCVYSVFIDNKNIVW